MKNRKFFFGRTSIRFWYLRYKDTPYFSYLLLGVSVLLCFILVYKVITPQVENWFSIRGEAEETQRKIAILKDNINFIGNQDKGTMSSQFDLALQALPGEKDFGTILITINEAALNSGVSLEDYSFQVGNIVSVTTNSKEPLSTVKITLTTRGSLPKTQKFISEIQERLPLADIQGIDGSSDSFSIKINFYQKPLPAGIQLQDEEPINRISQKNFSLLKNLAEWQKKTPSPDVFEEEENSSASGMVMPLF